MLGKRLAECRKRQGWTQARLATELGGGYDQTMVSRVESGRADFQFSGLVKAAVVLNVSLDYLAGLTDIPDPVQKLTAATASGFQIVAASQESDPHDRRFGGSPEPALGHLTFLHDWLVHHHIDPGKCSLIEILDKAMEPTLEMGDLVLLDHSRTRRTQGLDLCRAFRETGCSSGDYDDLGGTGTSGATIRHIRKSLGPPTQRS